MSTLTIIDALLSLMRLATRFKIDFAEVKALYDTAEANGGEVSAADREAIAASARAKIDWL